jgi:hypothetical protein
MNSSQFKKVWSIPILLFMLSMFGLITALVGYHILWDISSWILLSIPIYLIIKNYYKPKAK